MKKLFIPLGVLVGLLSLSAYASGPGQEMGGGDALPTLVIADASSTPKGEHVGNGAVPPKDVVVRDIT